MKNKIKALIPCLVISLFVSLILKITLDIEVWMSLIAWINISISLSVFNIMMAFITKTLNESDAKTK